MQFPRALRVMREHICVKGSERGDLHDVEVALEAGRVEGVAALGARRVRQTSLSTEQWALMCQCSGGSTLS